LEERDDESGFAGRQPARASRGCLSRCNALALMQPARVTAWPSRFAGKYPLALAGLASRAGQFALLNRMRNTDIFFVGGVKTNCAHS